VRLGRLFGAVCGVVALALLATGAQAAVVAAEPGDMVLGSARAPITVIEYASVGCPHCALWANEVFPAFRKKYIDTGKVRFVFREMLTGDPTLAAAGFLTARCAGPTKYFQVVDDIFAAQKAAAQGGTARTLGSVAGQAGLGEKQFLACVNDAAALSALQTRTRDVAERNHITGTPTFVVGDEKLEGEQTLAQLDTAIAKAR
jgi:protein-disulfide isomerase